MAAKRQASSCPKLGVERIRTWRTANSLLLCHTNYSLVACCSSESSHLWEINANNGHGGTVHSHNAANFRTEGNGEKFYDKYVLSQEVILLALVNCPYPMSSANGDGIASILVAGVLCPCRKRIVVARIFACAEPIRMQPKSPKTANGNFMVQPPPAIVW